MIVLVDVVIDERMAADARPGTDRQVLVELRDVTAVDGDAVVLARSSTPVVGAASSWLATTELIAAASVDHRSDLTIWARVTDSPDSDLSVGDWITMQSVPVDPSVDEQRVAAPVRPIG